MKRLFNVICLVSCASVSLTSCDTPGKKNEADVIDKSNETSDIVRKADTNLIYLHNQASRFGSSQEAFASITQEGIVVVDFYAEWCGPCRNLGSTIEQIASDFKDVTFLKIDVDKFKELSTSIRSIPVLVFYKNGVEIKRVTGSKSKKELKALINSL